MKKRISILLALVMALSLAVAPSSVSAMDIEPVTVYINGQLLQSDQGALLFNTTGSTMVPLRAICEALNCQVNYIEKSRTIEIVNRVIYISMQIDNDEMTKIDQRTKNEEKIKIPQAAIEMNGRTLVPARAIAEGLHATVSWNDPERRVDIYMPYDLIHGFYEGIAVVEKNGKMGAVNEQGVMIVPAIYDDALYFNEGFMPVKRNNLWGVVDTLGNEVVAPLYDEIFEFKNGHAVVHKYGKSGLINSTGKLVIPFDYDSDMGITQYDGYSIVKSNNKYGVMSHNGLSIAGTVYDMIQPYSEGIAQVQKNGKKGYIDASGYEVVRPEYDDVRPFYEGRARVQQDGKYGFVNADGKVAVPIVYDGAKERFNEGFAGVLKGDNWGFVNTDGKVVIPTVYEQVDNFSEGYARVKRGVKEGFVDTTGKVAITLSYDKVGKFSEGYAPIMKADKQGNKLWGFIDKKGIISIPLQFLWAGNFSNGLAWVVNEQEKYGFVDISGNLVIPFEFDDAREFSEGYAAVRKNNKWGFIDTAGKFAVTPAYGMALSFTNGVAPVGTGKTEDEAKKSGTVIIYCDVNFNEKGNFAPTGLSVNVRFPAKTTIKDMAGNTLTKNDLQVGDRVIVTANKLGSNYVASKMVVQK